MRAGRLAAIALLLLGFGWLTVLVAQGATQSLDNAVLDHFRPNRVWGTEQLVAVEIVDALSPPKATALACLIIGIVTLRRRCWSALLWFGGALVVTAAATMAVKVALRRPDIHGVRAEVGGGFPSGHMTVVVLTAAMAALVLWPKLWPTVVVLTGIITGMGLAQMVSGYHWFTDMIGGTMLGLIAVLCVTPGLHAAAHRRRAPLDGQRSQPSRR